MAPPTKRQIHARAMRAVQSAEKRRKSMGKFTVLLLIEKNYLESETFSPNSSFGASSLNLDDSTSGTVHYQLIASTSNFSADC